MPNTSRIPMSLRGLLVASALAASVLAGCAAPGVGTSAAPAVTVPAKAEDVVRARAQERWDLLLAEKYDGAYAYITPAYRALNTAKDYRNRFSAGAQWVSAKVQSVECAMPERCTVQTAVETLVVARGFNGPIKTIITETWLPEDGQWWYYQAR